MGTLEVSSVVVTAPGRDLAERSSSEEPSDEKEPEIPRLDPEATRYEVLRSLGRGGMAEVFLARRRGAEGFAREVALKCILADQELDEGVRRMFLTEARLASYLHHPGIAEAYDLEQIGGKLYLVLEHIDGVSLRAICAATSRREEAGRATRLPEDFTCYVMAHVAEALHYAHSQRGAEGEPLGIVHRDVSPSNIMVTRTGVPKLLDFGVAYVRLRGRERTQAGMTRGTLTYMSPEQAEGRELDGRSDLFSLALLFVEMLTGRRVFEAGNDVATVQAVLRCDPSRVEEATSGLRAGLQRICRRALARSPRERYQDGEELARAIFAYLRGLRPQYGARECAAELMRLGLAGEGVEKSDLPTRARVLRPGRSPARRVLVSSLAVLMTGLLAGFLFVAVSSRLKGPGEPLRAAAARAPLVEPARVALVPEEESLVKRNSPGRDEGEKRTGKGDEGAGPALGMTSEAAKGASAPVPRKERGEAVAVSRKKSPLQKPQAVTEEAQGTGGESGPVPAPVAQGEAKRGEDLNPAGAPSIPARTATSSFLHIADREVVANAAATLPRGTLLRARLTRELDPARGPGVFGVVAEDVVRNGVVMVEKGSVLDCRALAILNERVSISCDGVKASETRLSFTAIGLGEGDRPGLRAIDGVVPSGTPFVVCVTASAILE